MIFYPVLFYIVIFCGVLSCSDDILIPSIKATRFVFHRLISDNNHLFCSVVLCSVFFCYAVYCFVL
nr:MAG TPA: hypothetical protein [Caudoviricetes sp.]